MKNTNWHPAVRLQHWLTVALLLVCVGAIPGREAFDKTDLLRAELKQLHFLAGAALAALVLLRLWTRFVTRAPAHDAMHPAVAAASRLGHAALYGLLLVLPPLGYAAASGKGVPVEMLGLVKVAPLAIDPGTAKSLKALHESLAYGLLGLIGVHVAAAVHHALGGQRQGAAGDARARRALSPNRRAGGSSPDAPPLVLAGSDSATAGPARLGARAWRAPSGGRRRSG